MVIRCSLNFAAHLAAGLAFGALAVIVISRVSDRSVGRSQTHTTPPGPEMRPELGE
jgi:hypothetical protein